jgi:hypothetical protein
MTWKEAITKVLAEEGGPMHYNDITQKIIEKKYKQDYGATPEMTVNAQLTTNTHMFKKISPGVFELIESSVNDSHSHKKEKESLAADKTVGRAVKNVGKDYIVKNFGMFWSREKVDWKSGNMWGTLQNGTPINFKNQVGIYLLHDAREVIYVGQAVQQPIAKRLADHCKDRLNGRWDRFSWFGFHGVSVEDGTLDIEDFNKINFSMQNVANVLEAILIEGLEPRQNRKSGNEFGFEFLQATDPALEKRMQQALLKKLIDEKM